MPTRIWARVRLRAGLVGLGVALLVAPADAQGTAPRVRLYEADALPARALAPLDLSKASPRPELVAFEARGDTRRGTVTACMTMRASGWIDEAEPVVFERLAGLAAQTVVRARGRAPAWVETKREGPPGGTFRRELGPTPDDDAEATLVLGFVGDGHEAVACFAVGYGGVGARSATVEAPFVPAPPSGLVLGALVAAVHHPRAVVAVMACLAALLSALYVRARPRPRIARRIRSTRGT